jgi:nucleoside-diphosphate-sugar epimerase
MSFLSGRKFLIVGGNGYVGNRVAAKLIQHSAQVSVLSRYLKIKLEKDQDLNILKIKKLTGLSVLRWSLNLLKIK